MGASLLALAKSIYYNHYRYPITIILTLSCKELSQRKGCAGFDSRKRSFFFFFFFFFFSSLLLFVVIVVLFCLVKSDGQEISTIEWQELKNRFPSFFVHK